MSTISYADELCGIETTAFQQLVAYVDNLRIQYMQIEQNVQECTAETEALLLHSKKRGLLESFWVQVHSLFHKS